MAAKSPNTRQYTSRICYRCRRTKCLLMPSEKMRVGDRQASRLGEKKCYLANLPAEIDLGRLATTVMARWICEQAHLQLKEQFGLDHFETVLARSSSSRSYDDDCLRLLAALPHCQDGHKNESTATTSAQPASRASRHRRSHSSAIRSAIRIPQNTGQRRARREQICQSRVSAHPKRLYDRAGNGREVLS